MILMPVKWFSFWGLITPPEGHAPPRLWPWLVAAGAGVLIAVVVVWFKFGWSIEAITTDFLVLTSFVILIGLVLLKVRKETDDGERTMPPEDQRLENPDAQQSGADQTRVSRAGPDDQ